MDMEMRQVLNAIFYVLRSGCPWRYLPHHFPNFNSVYLHGARQHQRLLHQIAPSSQHIGADSIYGRAGLTEWMLESFQIVLEIVKRNPEQREFAVLLRRWVVERTFA